MRHRHDVWGDDLEEREADATIAEFAQDAGIQRGWQEHPAIAPLKVVARFIGRNGKRVGIMTGFAMKAGQTKNTVLHEREQ